jgi:putative ABC transport system permease protein
MAPRDLLSLVWSNMLRRKARVAMTAIGVVIGTAAVIVLVSLGAGLQRITREDLGSIGELTEINVFSRGSILGAGGSVSASEEATLDERTLDAFRELPGVVAVTPVESLRSPAVLRLNRLEGQARIVGIDASQTRRLGFDLESGTARLGQWQALVGNGVAERFYNPQTGRVVGSSPGGAARPSGARRPAEEVPDLQGQSLRLMVSKQGEDGQAVERSVRFRVAGVLEESSGEANQTVYLALNDVIELNRWFSGSRYNPARQGYSRALVKVQSPDHALTVEQEINSRGFIAWSAGSMLQTVNTYFLIIQAVFGGIGAIALVVAAFGIANTMLMAIYERTREIGLMKAVGATNRDVMSVFLTEAGGIGLLGGIGGILLGVGGGTLIDLVATTYLAAQAVQSGANAAEANISIIYTPLWLPIFALVFSAVVGVVSGVYPAVQAASLDPITALKYE